MSNQTTSDTQTAVWETIGISTYSETTKELINTTHHSSGQATTSVQSTNHHSSGQTTTSSTQSSTTQKLTSNPTKKTTSELDLTSRKSSSSSVELTTVTDSRTTMKVQGRASTDGSYIGSTSNDDRNSQTTSGGGSSGVSIGVYVGVALGVILTVIVIVTVVVILVIRYKRKKYRRSNTPRIRKISAGVKRPTGVDIVDRRMIEHPAHLRKDSAINIQRTQLQSLPEASTSAHDTAKDYSSVRQQSSFIENSETVTDTTQGTSVGQQPSFIEPTDVIIETTSDSSVTQQTIEASEAFIDTKQDLSIKQRSCIETSGAGIDTPSDSLIDVHETIDTVKEVTMETKVNNSPQTNNQVQNDNTNMTQQENNTKQQDSSKDKNEDVVSMYQQQHTGYSKPRKLSGPNNKVPTNLLSGWKNKYAGQEQMFEEEEEEEVNS